MTAMLKAEGLQAKRVQRLMRKMGIAALGPKPNTTKPAPGHKIYPYLLRNMTIDRPNHLHRSLLHKYLTFPENVGILRSPVRASILPNWRRATASGDPVGAQQ
jgi:hypothetical protein